MYWRGIPHFDPDQFAAVELPKKQGAGGNALLPVLSEMVKYLAVIVAIFLILAMTLSAF
jgi:hypothetical protein